MTQASPRVRTRDLRVELLDGTPVVQEIAFEVAPGKVLALVGESGCGKTSVALAMLGYARPGTRLAAGSVEITGIDLLTLSPRECRRVRGRLVAYVPQDPATSLNPAYPVGKQVGEVLRVHRWPREDRAKRVAELFDLVGLPATGAFLSRYPHQLSGGQQQRVLIASALALDPELLVLDEPTTGLDVTTQKRVLGVVDEVRARTGVALLYVTHDLSVVANLADDVAVMYGGRIVETAPRTETFGRPVHPYTIKLIQSIPRVEERMQLRGIPGAAVAPGERPKGCPFVPRCPRATPVCSAEMPAVALVSAGHTVRCHHWAESIPEPSLVDPAVSPPVKSDSLLRAKSLVAVYRGRGTEPVRALDGVDLDVGERECVAVVGESGSGKSTLARCLVGLQAFESGTLWFGDQELAPRARARPVDARRAIQIVFQNPDASLNPRQRVVDIVSRPVIQFSSASRREAAARANELLELVRLSPALGERFPAELSGGEKQRVAIARALAAEPSLVVCDEITSALDVSVQAAIIDLLMELRVRTGTSLVFISHDLAIVRSIADRVVVLHDGRVTEAGLAESVFEAPEAEYTRALLEAVPSLAGAAR